MKRLLPVALAAFVLAAAVPLAARAGDPSFDLTIQNHRFQPEMLKVPANKRVVLKVKNADATPEEFESHDLNVEKVIPGHSKGIVVIGPLKPGTYGYYGEFHEKTAKGKIIAE